MFSSKFKDKIMKYIKDMSQKICISSLINYFYHNRMTVVNKVIGSSIYSSIDTLIYIGYMGILILHKLSAYDNKLEN